MQKCLLVLSIELKLDIFQKLNILTVVYPRDFTETD